MKRIVSLIFAVAIVTVNALAQEPPQPPAKRQAPQKTPEERADNMTKRLTKELALNADQQAKIKAIILQREQDREKMMKEGKVAREKTNEEFKSILTPEQYQKFEEKKEEMRQKHQERRNPPVPPKGGDTPPPPPAPEQK